MSRQVIMIEDGVCETIRIKDGPTPQHTIKPIDYKASTAQAWGTGLRGKGLTVLFDISNLPLNTLLRACVETDVWLEVALRDTIDAIIAEHVHPDREEDDGWTKEGVLDIANQLETYAKRLRKAAR